MSAQAAVQYWDPTNGTAAGTGSATPAGTWRDSTNASPLPAFSSASDGTSVTSNWINGNDAVFSAGTDATGAFNVAVSTNVIVHNLTVEEGSPTLATNALLFTGASPTFTVAADSTLTTTGGFSSSGTTTGSFTKAGAGTLVLNSGSGASNYSVATTISAGTLQLGAGSTTGFLPTTSAIIDNGTLLFNRSNIVSQGGGFSSNITGTGGLVQAGTGTVTLNSANTYTGATTVNAGTLNLDFTGASPATNIISSSSALILGGGSLSLTGKASTTNSQQVSGLTVNPGVSAIALNANATANPLLLNLGAITRNVGGTVNFTQPTGTISASNGITTTTSDTNGILGGYATVGGTDWAHNNGTNLVAASYTNDTWASGNNTTVTASSSPASGATTNSLRFNAAGASTVTLAGTNVISSGGILVTTNVGANTSEIIGGMLKGAAGKDLVVIQNNSGTNLIIASIVADNGAATGLTKSGPGLLTLSGINTYTGSTYINSGNVNAGSTQAFGVNSAVVMSNVTGAFLNLVHFNNSIGSLTGGGSAGGSIGLNAATLTVGGDNTSPPAYAAGIGGTGGLIKVGTGALTLSGNNSYTGGTTVSAGTLVAANTTITKSSTGTGDVTLNGGALSSTAGVTSYISGNVVAGSGDHAIAPGGTSSVGQLNVGGLHGLNAHTTFDFEINGATHDLLSDSTALIFGSGTPTVALTTSGSLSGNYTLLSYASTSGLNTSSFSLPTAPTGYNWNITNTMLELDQITHSASFAFTTAAPDGGSTMTGTANPGNTSGSHVITLTGGGGGSYNPGYLNSITADAAANDGYVEIDGFSNGDAQIAVLSITVNGSAPTAAQLAEILSDLGPDAQAFATNSAGGSFATSLQTTNPDAYNALMADDPNFAADPFQVALLNSTGLTPGSLTYLAVDFSNETDASINLGNVRVSDIAAIPEPGGLTLVSLMAVATLVRRRRKIQPPLAHG
jgi:fibronectin-binding autotransporter adhesin